MTGSRAAGERLRVGIIGGGAITQVAHLPVLKKLKSIELPAICDTDLPKARALADRFGVKDAFDDIEDLLRYEALDAVVICTPNHLHESHILAALSANLHVLVEKPLAMSSASAQRIMRAAEKRDRLVMVGMNHRYRPDVQIVRSFVQAASWGRSRACGGAGTCSGPAVPSWDGASDGTRRGEGPCSTSASRCSTSASGWAATRPRRG
jgi:predicted dehydrogenase